MEQKQSGRSGLGASLRRAGGAVASPFVALWDALRFGDWKTRLSFLIMGAGNFLRGQVIRGLAFLAGEGLFIWFIVGFASKYLADFGTLGTNVFEREWDEVNQIYINMPGDNSMVILLYSVVSLFIIGMFILFYFMNIRSAYNAQVLQQNGKKLPKFKDDWKSLFDANLHGTMLLLPTIGVIAFTVLPVLFMILIAFTNFDRAHQPPGTLFTWVGLENFKDIFWQNPLKSHTFFSVLGWTLIWAVFATFLNYFLGMALALIINKKGIRGKGFWRTCFILSIAVPGFVTLLLMRQILADQGTLNVLLHDVLGWIDAPIKFLNTTNWARLSVIVVNLWIGIPYSMLITSGILMNIPDDLFEAARIDGANPFQQFMYITTPYMLFITTPYLITQFVGNINNFNAIFLLTGGGPLTLDYYQAGKTDLLVTWLYKLTVDFQDYNLASTIGILVFVICAGISLATFNLTASGKKEDTFS